ncbi:MAG: RES family NAD+ phosphorylase [Bacteroidales bacterium]|nr:RES family NAD+ phosphorylase [Bacteroidales bacterium]
MRVFRLSKKKYCRDLSGKGAEQAGGRWNSRGTAMVYTSDSRALCTAEIAVHFPLGIIPVDYYLTIIEINKKPKVSEVNPKQLPNDWNTFPHAHFTQEIGDEFIKDGEFLILKVPSAVVLGDFNYLINPFHKDIRHIKIIDTEEFSFDKRLFKG